MIAQRLMAVLIAFSLLSSSGCCWLRRVLCDECCDPCDRGPFTYFCGKSCGEAYWGDWHSHPPKYGPCDDCGQPTDLCECGPVGGRYARSTPARMTVGHGDCDCH